MTHRPPLPGRLSRYLLDRAVRTLPAARRDWAEAMRAEAEFIDGDFSRLVWAGGCLIAALKERNNHMKDLKVSRGVLAVEWLVCFGFLAMWGILEVWRYSGRRTAGNLSQIAAYLSLRGPFVSAFGALEVLVSALGFVGLFMAFRLLGTGRRAATAKHRDCPGRRRIRVRFGACFVRSPVGRHCGMD